MLLVDALQHSDGATEAKVFYADEAGLLTEHSELAKALDRRTPLCVLPRLEGQRQLTRLVSGRRNSANLLALLHREYADVDELFIFNGLRPEAQALGSALKGKAVLHYVEDGLDAYLPLNLEEPSLLERVSYRLLNRRRYPVDMTTALAYEYYHVLIPELFRGGNAARTIPIDREAFHDSALDLSGCIGDGNNVPDVENLFLLAHSEQITDVPKYLASLSDQVDNYSAVGLCAIKPHPRESSALLLAGVKEIRAEALPRELPVELLTGRLAAKCHIHCGLTTFVLTSRYLVPGRTVVVDADEAAQKHLQELEKWDPSIMVEPRG